RPSTHIGPALRKHELVALSRDLPCGRGVTEGWLWGEHEELKGELGVLAVGAEEGLDGAVGEALDGVDEADLHAVLPGDSGLVYLVPFAGLEERLFRGGVAAGEHEDDEVGLEVGAAAGRSAPEVLLEQRDDRV